MGQDGERGRWSLFEEEMGRDRRRAHLAQMQVCVTEEIWVVLPYQADHVIIQLVLFEHGDGKIGLFHCHVQPGDGRYTWGLLDPSSCCRIVPKRSYHCLLGRGHKPSDPIQPSSPKDSSPSTPTVGPWLTFQPRGTCPASPSPEPG